VVGVLSDGFFVVSIAVVRVLAESLVVKIAAVEYL
jgi:hypothetical protein